MLIDILRSGTKIGDFNCAADGVATFTHSLMNEHKIVCQFLSYDAMGLMIGDYIMYNGIKYKINTPPSETKLASYAYQYNITFESPLYDLYNKLYTHDDGDGPLTEWSLGGSPEDFIDIMIDCMNSIDSGWTKGTIEDADLQLIDFSNVTCREALNTIVEKFGLEFYLNNKEFNLVKKVGADSTLVLKYGQGKGLYEISRQAIDNKNLITRLYALGSDRNNDGKRLSVPALDTNVALYGVREGVQIFEEVYPHREGLVGTVGSDGLSFQDSAMDFDLNSYLTTDTAQISFLSGDMVGYNLEITGYNATTKTFTLKAMTDTDGTVLPNTDDKPRTGDKYTILGIEMPQSYKDTAIAELTAKRNEYAAENSIPRVQYGCKLDMIWAANNNILVNIGDRVTVKDDAMGVDTQIRVSSISFPLYQPFNITFVIADTVGYTVAERIIAKTIDNTKAIKTVDRSRILDYRRGAANQDALRASIFDTDGYFNPDNIRPLSIETLMLSVGAKSQNFQLSGAYFQFANDYLSLSVTAGKLIHNTMSIEGLGSIWNIASSSSISISDSAKVYYLYAKCSKTELTGTWMASDTQYEVESVTGYYMFLIGVIYALSDGDRGYSLSYGYASINGRTIIAGRIQSLDGNTYFDLDSNEIQGKIKFTSGSSGYNNISDKPDLTPFEDTTNYVNNTLPDVISGLQNQIDGQIMSWFYSGAPSLTVPPVTSDGSADTGWTTNDIKDKHLGDLYYNQDDGKGYRFTKASGVYSWTLLADTDIALALSKADAAQDTADGKRRVFVAQPTTPYDIGDLWVQGTGGDIMRCQTSRVSGSYQSTDWILASKYTDDTTANTKNRMFVSATAPSALAVGDIWIDTSNGNLIKVWSGSAWGEYQDADIAAAYSLAGTKNKTFTGSATPTGAIEGDIWLDTGNGNIIKRYDGAIWVAMQDTNIATAITNAANAQSTADKAEAKTDFISDTTIDGNVVATGTLLVGDASGANAGISGVTDGSVKWRFWAGAGFATRANAPFRVDNDGSMFAIKGVVGGFTLAENSLTASANDTTLQFESLGNGSGYFRVNQPGDAICSIRTDEARNALRLYTQGVGDISLYINGQAGATAINSYGGHNLVSRSGETWSAPGMLGAMNIQYKGGSTNPTIIDNWGITGLGFGISWTGTDDRYRWTHNLGHTDYMLVCNLNTQDGTTQIISMYSKSENYVDFAFNSVVNNAYANLLLIGRNIQA